MEDSKSASNTNSIGKSNGVLLILTFSKSRVLTPNKIRTASVAKITKACFGKIKKSVVRLVKAIGKIRNNKQNMATDAFST